MSSLKDLRNCSALLTAWHWLLSPRLSATAHSHDVLESPRATADRHASAAVVAAQICAELLGGAAGMAVAAPSTSVLGHGLLHCSLL